MAAKILYFTVYLLSCLFINVVGNILCESGYCREHLLDVGCAVTPEHCEIQNATHSGMSMLSPTTCNCCEFCLIFYGEGEHCSLGGPGTGFTVGRCADGLTCVNDEAEGHAVCKRMQTKCHAAQDSFDERLARGEVGALEMRPHCDGKGLYAPFECVPAHTCFCQSEEGERIFGEALYLGTQTRQTMNCRCSRLHEKIKKSITPGVTWPVIGPRCTSNGNFNPVQCLKNKCYCIDTVTGEIQDGEGKMIDLEEKPISELECYDPELDLYPQNSGEPPFEYTTPCFEDMKERILLMQESEKDGFNVDFFSSIQDCMPDGTYGRVARTRTGEKICVDERGQQIGNYTAKPNTDKYNSMNCNCAQTSLVMSSLLEQPVCCKNGNFRPIQCRRGLCRCVDNDGRQTERENADVTRLSCYTPNWRIC